MKMDAFANPLFQLKPGIQPTITDNLIEIHAWLPLSQISLASGSGTVHFIFPSPRASAVLPYLWDHGLFLFVRIILMLIIDPKIESFLSRENAI